MSVFDTIEPPQPTAEQGAMRVRRTMSQAFNQIEKSLKQVGNICEQHGADEVATALGKDAKEVKKLYKALSKFVEEHKPDASVGDCPI